MHDVMLGESTQLGVGVGDTIEVHQVERVAYQVKIKTRIQRCRWAE